MVIFLPQDLFDQLSKPFSLTEAVVAYNFLAKLIRVQS